MWRLNALVTTMIAGVNAGGINAGNVRRTTGTAGTGSTGNITLELPVGVYRTPLYGGINDYAYYFVDVLVGNPPVRQSVILDSGSSLLGFPCTTCGRRCGRHIDNPFDLAASSSSQTYTCHDQRCVSTESCSEAGQCRYSQVYSEGSSIEGFFFSDVLSLASADPGHPNPKLRYDYIGCHNKETVLFTSQQASGILGVSFPRGGKQPTVMDGFMGAAGGARRKQFAICASEDGGVLLIGGSDAKLNKPSFSKNGSSTFTSRWLRGWNRLPATVEQANSDVVWAKMVNNNAYAIGVSGISTVVPDADSGPPKYTKLVERGFGEVLVDSGTTYTYLPNEVYQKVARYLIDVCNNNNVAKETERAGQCMRSKQDLVCFDFSETNLPVSTLLQRLPSLSLELTDGAVIEWNPESYLFRKTDTVWCSALENNRRSQTILGMSFLKQKQVIFDRENSLIGFVSANCPVHKTRVIIDDDQQDASRLSSGI